MSNYTAITRHPQNHKYYQAEWKDDYFGRNLYGVKFPDDPVVYPAEQVVAARLETFWAQDVLDTLRKIYDDDAVVLSFLMALQATYEERWKRDPEGGEGATNWLNKMRGGDVEENI